MKGFGISHPWWCLGEMSTLLFDFLWLIERVPIRNSTSLFLKLCIGRTEFQTRELYKKTERITNKDWEQFKQWKRLNCSNRKTRPLKKQHTPTRYGPPFRLYEPRFGLYGNRRRSVTLLGLTGMYKDFEEWRPPKVPTPKTLTYTYTDRSSAVVLFFFIVTVRQCLFRDTKFTF